MNSRFLDWIHPPAMRELMRTYPEMRRECSRLAFINTHPRREPCSTRDPHGRSSAPNAGTPAADAASPRAGPPWSGPHHPTEEHS